MAFSLCIDLGFPHPDYLMPLLTSKQFAEWETFYLIQRGKIKIPEKINPDEAAARIDALLSRAG